MDKDCLIVSMARHYGITDEDLSHDLLELLKPYQETYVDLLQTRVHLYHKSGDTRTSNLGALSVSSIRTKELEVNAVINHFAANHNNRRIVLL